jgi:hypothetical protein
MTRPTWRGADGMYGFEITVTLRDGDPSALSAKLDDIAAQLATACQSNDEFKGYMIVERSPREVTFLITADAADEVKALAAATSWLHTAVHAVGFATPGWLRRAEQVFDAASA